MTPSNRLEALRQWTTAVADTGDIDEIARLKPTEATTNPSLILKAARTTQGEAILAAARCANESPRLRIDRVVTDFGKAILEHIPGRVSTEVDARLSFDTRATIEKARRLIALYEAGGISRERVLIKIAATWEGCEAARVLEQEGIHCNMTLLFSLAQAKAAAQAGATLISPFVGRIYDWAKKEAGSAWNEAENAGTKDPGVQSVTAIYRTLKAAGSKTQIMGASFRNLGEITALAGCDLLTIAPKFIDALRGDEAPLERVLSSDTLTPTAPVAITESEFRWETTMSAMANEKLAQGIRAFAADTETLEKLLV